MPMSRRDSSCSTELNIESLPAPVEFADCRQETVPDDQNAVYVFFLLFTLIINNSSTIIYTVLIGFLKKIPVHIKLHNMMI